VIGIVVSVVSVDCRNIETFLLVGRRSGGLEGRVGLHGRRLE
jgi:hypothetical protein